MTFKPPTTPKQRATHREKLEQIVIDAGFQKDPRAKDSWKLPNNQNLRIKFKDVNVRIERRLTDGTWVGSGSWVISKISPDQWDARVHAIQRLLP